MSFRLSRLTCAALLLAPMAARAQAPDTAGTIAGVTDFLTACARD